jgi:hypothetical protein
MAKSQRLPAACFLSVLEMTTGLPKIYQSLLTQGRSKRVAEAVLDNTLKPTEENDDPGLLYILSKLVANICDCKYGLGWDTLHRNYHCVISLFAVPHMSLRHQQERQVIQDRMGQT